MKKILFMCLIALVMLFTSCVATKEYSYTSPIDYMNELQELNEYYNIKGFYLNGESWNTENDLHINGYQYFINHFTFGNNSGNVTQVVPNFQNDYLYKNSYKFQDSIGNTVKFTLGYKVSQFESAEKIKIKYGYEENIFYDEIGFSEICDCETNNFNTYVDLCKNDEIQKFNGNLDKNSKAPITYIDKKKTDIGVIITIGTFFITLCSILIFKTF